MLKLAEHILETKTADFDPSEFIDHYEEAVVAMLKKKQAGLPTPKDRSVPPPQNVVNLMDALKRSIAEGKRGPAPSVKERQKADRTAKKPTARSPRQKRAS